MGHFEAFDRSNKSNTNAVKHDPVALTSLMANPRTGLAVSRPLRLIIRLAFRLVDFFNIWRFPRKTDGCFEHMTLIDKLHWLYKSATPIRLAEKGSSLEAFFAEQANTKLSLPRDFEQAGQIMLAAVGDLMQNDLLSNSAHSLYEGIASELFSADVSFANLEAPLTTQPQRKLLFVRSETPSTYISAGQFQVLKGYKGRKYTALSTAANHAWDYGEEGVLSTLDALAREGIAAVGTNREKKDRKKATIIEVKGVKIGLIGLTFGLNGKKIDLEQEYHLNWVRLNDLSSDVDLSLPMQQISFCREQKCDFITGSLHWGLEFEFFPAQRQRGIAHQLAEAGLDLIISHHPHVVQPVEFYRPRRDPERTVVIAYSLGNLVSPFYDDHLTLSFLLQITLASGKWKDQRRTDIAACQIIPVCQRAVMVEGKPAVRLEKVTDVTAFRLPFELKNLSL
jgi:poly-gamma-glutamate capsule biosynthesis protein CapA/YwtB (metallophosphatase superfamily)